MNVHFHGVDSWNRPVFKAEGRELYFGCVNKLFDAGNIQTLPDRVTASDLLFFGTKFGCEPWGDEPVEPLNIVWEPEAV